MELCKKGEKDNLAAYLSMGLYISFFFIYFHQNGGGLRLPDYLFQIKGKI